MLDLGSNLTKSGQPWIKIGNDTVPTDSSIAKNDADEA
jgi:hypothetical protein